MVASKLTKEDCKQIAKLINKGYEIKELAKKYGVDRSTIYNRCKYLYQSKKIPLETRNKVIQTIKEGYTKVEAAQLYGLNIGTVTSFIRGINGNTRQGNHIIHKNGIQLLNRLMNDEYLIFDFNVSVVRNLQQKFPIIKSAGTRIKLFSTCQVEKNKPLKHSLGRNQIE